MSCYITFYLALFTGLKNSPRTLYPVYVISGIRYAVNISRVGNIYTQMNKETTVGPRFTAPLGEYLIDYVKRSLR